MNLVQRISSCSSDGWDRTAQLSSISMFLLDPHFRTIRGFCELVEKEWLAFGHQFARRHGHADGKMSQHGDSQRSCVFLQFLDCIWQLCAVNPCVAEFNSHFLSTIMDEVYNCRFGTFLYDCESQRIGLASRTVSLWTYVMSPSVVDLYRNPLYVTRPDKSASHALVGDIFPHHLAVWDYHLRPHLKLRSLASVLSLPETDQHSAERGARELSLRLEVLEAQLRQKLT